MSQHSSKKNLESQPGTEGDALINNDEQLLESHRPQEALPSVAQNNNDDDVPNDEEEGQIAEFQPQLSQPNHSRPGSISKSSNKSRKDNSRGGLSQGSKHNDINPAEGMARPPSATGSQDKNGTKAVTSNDQAQREKLSNAVQPSLFDGPEHAEARKILAKVQGQNQPALSNRSREGSVKDKLPEQPLGFGPQPIKELSKDRTNSQNQLTNQQLQKDLSGDQGSRIGSRQGNLKEEKKASFGFAENSSGKKGGVSFDQSQGRVGSAQNKRQGGNLQVPSNDVSAFAPQPDSDGPDNERKGVFESDDEESVMFDQAAKDNIQAHGEGKQGGEAVEDPGEQKVLNFWGGTQSKWVMLAKDKPTQKPRPDSAARAKQLKQDAREMSNLDSDKQSDQGLNVNQNYMQDVRRKTLRFAQALADDDDEEAAKENGDLTPGGAAKKVFSPEETMAMLAVNLQTSTDGNENREGQANLTEAGEDDEESLFADFRFRSFRQHKVIQEDVNILEIPDPEPHEKINMDKYMAKAKVEKDAVELVSMTADEAQLEQKKAQELEKAKDREEVKKMIQDNEFVDKSEKLTVKELERRKKDLKALIDRKQERSIQDFTMKKEVLGANFKTSVNTLISKVKDQKEIITSSYGPIVLNQKRGEEPIFDINAELDPEGHKFLRKVNDQQDKIPSTLLVKIRTVRCLKDKVSSGHFLMIVHVYDRLGGNQIKMDEEHVKNQYRFLSSNLRDFSMKKRDFLNTQNRQIQGNDQKTGKATFEVAKATGLNFYKPDAEEEDPEVETEEQAKMNTSMEEYGFVEDKAIDKDVDKVIDFKRYTKFVRFDGRHQDENCDFDEMISVMIPANPDSTNILLFQLVLLESDQVDQDYVVGWGAFPLMNSDFALNEGKYKIPLMFGNVDPTVDQFGKFEKKMMRDLDEWLCNCYFEIEKVNLRDLKVEQCDCAPTAEAQARCQKESIHTQRLFYKPVTGNSAQEQQQKLKMHDEDQKIAIKLQEKDDQRKQETDRSNSRKMDSDSGSRRGSVRGMNRSVNHNLSQMDEIEEGDEDEYDEEEDDSSSDEYGSEDDQIDKFADDYAKGYEELLYNADKSADQINYDNYHYSVTQKYDMKDRNLCTKKFKYIFDEVFLDIHPRMWRSIQFKTSIIFIIFLGYLRMFTHYTAQFVMASLIGVPITQFHLGWWKITINSAPYEIWQEVAILLAGAFANLLVFLFMAAMSVWMKKLCGWFPKYWHSVICWHGMWMVADPSITLVMDCILNARNHYVKGEHLKWLDYFVLPDYFRKNAYYGNAGIGIYLTFFMFLVINLVNGYAFYRYMVFFFKDGRILDLYRRLSGEYNLFFVPQDREVSLNYLRWVLTRAKQKNCIIHSERKTIYDKFGIDRLVNFIQIYKVEDQPVKPYSEGKTVQIVKRSRLFFKDYTGALSEVPQARGIAKKADLVKLQTELRKVNDNGEVESNATGHGTVLNIDELDKVIVDTNNHLDQKKDAMMEAMDERYEEHHRSNTNMSRRDSQNAPTSPGLGGSFKTNKTLLGGLGQLMKGKRNNTNSFTPTNLNNQMEFDQEDNQRLL